ncbi:Crp/Fnr family transcriptional regulator [Dellaglioa sp. BT-FLS60]
MNQFLHDKVPVLEAHWAEIHALFTHEKVSAKETLLFEGEVAENIYFIESGALRLWNNDEGKDISFQFFFENQVVASFESFYLGEPSQFSLESLEPSDLMVLSKAHLDELIQKYPEINEDITKIFAGRFMEYTNYFLSRIKENPVDRYLSLVENQPMILKRVPDYHIASYLGITPVSLSRIKNRTK